jgi:hypothetical protein
MVWVHAVLSQRSRNSKSKSPDDEKISMPAFCGHFSLEQSCQKTMKKHKKKQKNIFFIV